MRAAIAAGMPNVVARNTASWARVFGFSVQKLPPPQPAVIPRVTISLIQGQKGLLWGTSPKAAPVHGGGT